MKAQRKRYLTDTPALYALVQVRSQLLREIRDATHMIAVAKYEFTRGEASEAKRVALYILAALDGSSSIMKPADRKALFQESACAYRDSLRRTLVWRAKNAPSLLTEREARRAAIFIAEDERRAA